MGPKTNKPLTVYFGARVAEKRKKLGMSQEVLAEKTGISQESLSRMEKGVIAPRFERLQNFADALQCSVADLFPVAKKAGESNGPLTEALSSLSDEEQRDLIEILERIVKFADGER